jgi:hypothetical protein
MTSPYYPPSLGDTEYHCPHCNVYARQLYAHLQSCTGYSWISVVDGKAHFNDVLHMDWVVTKCVHCSKIAVWKEAKMIFPRKMIVALPNPDLQDDIKSDYLEASSVLGDSPRAAAALLRLALQKLCKQLGEKGENINDDIKSLVAKGLNPLVQKSLDALRITGNNAVHPGEINLTEDPARVVKLFELINFIANKMITEPKEIEGFYSQLPEGALDAVRRRDNPKE